MDPRKLYFAAGLLAAGVPAALLQTIPEAEAKQVKHEVMIEFDLSPAAGATIDGFLEAQVCPKVDVAFNVPEGTCNSFTLDTQASSVTLHKRDTDGDGLRDTWKLSRQIVLPGQFVAD